MDNVFESVEPKKACLLYCHDTSAVRRCECGWVKCVSIMLCLVCPRNMQVRRSEDSLTEIDWRINTYSRSIAPSFLLFTLLQSFCHQIIRVLLRSKKRNRSLRCNFLPSITYAWFNDNLIANARASSSSSYDQRTICFFNICERFTLTFTMIGVAALFDWALLVTLVLWIFIRSMAAALRKINVKQWELPWIHSVVSTYPARLTVRPVFWNPWHLWSSAKRCFKQKVCKHFSHFTWITSRCLQELYEHLLE